MYEKNDNPLEFENVEAYTSGSHTPAADAKIKHFSVCQYDTGDPQCIEFEHFKTFFRLHESV